VQLHPEKWALCVQYTHPEELAPNSSFSHRCKVTSKLLSPFNRGVLGRNTNAFSVGLCSEPVWGAFSARQSL